MSLVANSSPHTRDSSTIGTLSPEPLRSSRSSRTRPASAPGESGSVSASWTNPTPSLNIRVMNG